MVPVLKTQATREVGVEELLKAIENHQTHLTQSGKRELKTRQFLMNEVADILNERLNHSVFESFKTTSGKDLLDQLVNRQIDPYRAADILSRI